MGSEFVSFWFSVRNPGFPSRRQTSSFNFYTAFQGASSDLQGNMGETQKCVLKMDSVFNLDSLTAKRGDSNFSSDRNQPKAIWDNAWASYLWTEENSYSKESPRLKFFKLCLLS